LEGMCWCVVCNIRKEGPEGVWQSRMCSMSGGNSWNGTHSKGRRFREWRSKVYRWEGVSYLRYRDKMDRKGVDAHDKRRGC